MLLIPHASQIRDTPSSSLLADEARRNPEMQRQLSPSEATVWFEPQLRHKREEESKYCPKLKQDSGEFRVIEADALNRINTNRIVVSPF
jgi:hypothetical protein